MRDLVDRLKRWDCAHDADCDALAKEAASEIERLKSDNAELVRINADLTTEVGRQKAMLAEAREVLGKIYALKDMQRADLFTQGSFNQGHCAGSYTAYNEAADIVADLWRRLGGTE